MTAHIVAIDSPLALDAALHHWQQGHIVAFPTDTVYGIGVPALDAAAIEQLYLLKQRPRSQAIPLLLADPADIERVAAQVPPQARTLAQHHWPGGLTLVVPAVATLPSVLLAGGSTVALRVPNHPALRTLIRHLGQPLAATSANLHGQPSPPTAHELAQLFGARVGVVLDGGHAPSDAPSTVVDCCGEAPRVLRQGCVHLATIPS